MTPTEIAIKTFIIIDGFIESITHWAQSTPLLHTSTSGISLTSTVILGSESTTVQPPPLLHTSTSVIPLTSTVILGSESTTVQPPPLLTTSTSVIPLTSTVIITSESTAEVQPLQGFIDSLNLLNRRECSLRSLENCFESGGFDFGGAT